MIDKETMGSADKGETGLSGCNWPLNDEIKSDLCASSCVLPIGRKKKNENANPVLTEET